MTCRHGPGSAVATTEAASARPRRPGPVMWESAFLTRQCPTRAVQGSRAISPTCLTADRQTVRRLGQGVPRRDGPAYSGGGARAAVRRTLVTHYLRYERRESVTSHRT